MDPANPGRIAHFNGRQQHPIKRDEHRNLNHDREAAAHRVDFFFAVNSHHLLLHLLWVVFQALTHFHDFRIDSFHLGHAGVGLGVEPIERQLEQEYQGHNGPAPVLQEAKQAIEQPVKWFGQNG